MPDVLISGHHENIKNWRRQNSLENTYKKRPRLLENTELSKQDHEFIQNLKKEENKKWIS